jgi:ADP-ribosylglycohydrolase
MPSAFEPGAEAAGSEGRHQRLLPNRKDFAVDRIVIGRRAFRDKVFACWLGKNIGGTLGAPHEGKRFALALDFYDPVPTQAAANDDLDLQLVWLKLLEDEGADPPLPRLAEYWSRYACSYPWNEYGFFMRNWSRGLRPPVAGCFENYFVDEMGSPIRSEIWACLHAGDPQAASRMAWKDSALDHAGGEGTWGEMFWAAVEAAAFVESDPRVLIHVGLAMIPLASHVARSIREAVWCRDSGLPLGDARERIAGRFGHLQPCNAVPNHGFTILGWLYGQDFGDRLCKAVNCGYDTDCTGATLGSLLGILGGRAGIPAKWREPIGTAIVLHPFTRGFKPPSTIEELTERTVALSEKAAAGKDEIAFGAKTRLPEDVLTRLFRNDLALAARGQDVHAGVEVCGGREVALHYGGEPVLRPGIGRTVRVTVDGREEHVELAVPAGWTAERLGPARFRLFSAEPVADRNPVTVTAPGVGAVPFTVLGPGEAKGFPAGDNVAKCPKCQARVEACICGR